MFRQKSESSVKLAKLKFPGFDNAPIVSNMLYGGDNTDLLLFDEVGRVVKFKPEQYFQDNEADADDLQEVDDEDIVE